jgi:group I intron endonuclease
MIMNTAGIYMIRSKCKPERVYIGSAVNIKRRWQDHRKRLKASQHPNRKLQNHYSKYHDLEFSVLLGCEKEDLLKNEQFFIDSYNPWFNNTKIAGSCLGRKISEETREKLRKSHLGQISWNKGQHSSPEAIEKMRASLKGRTVWNKGIKTGIIPPNAFKKGHKIKLGKGKYANDEERLVAHREANRRYRLKLKKAA